MNTGLGMNTCPSPGDLPDPGIGPASLAFLLHWQAGSLPLHLGMKAPIDYSAMTLEFLGSFSNGERGITTPTPFPTAPQLLLAGGSSAHFNSNFNLICSCYCCLGTPIFLRVIVDQLPTAAIKNSHWVVWNF